MKGISDSNVEDTFATLEGPLKLDMNATFSKKPEIFKFRDQTTSPDNDIKPSNRVALLHKHLSLLGNVNP